MGTMRQGSTFHYAGMWQQLVKVTNVLCADGKRRTFTPTRQSADTFFSHTGRVQVAGKTVNGFLTLGYENDANGEDAWTFSATCGGKNAYLLNPYEPTGCQEVDLYRSRVAAGIDPA